MINTINSTTSTYECNSYHKKERIMQESTIEFICPVKTNAGKKALDHIPVELKALDAERPLVITDQLTADKGLSKHIVFLILWIVYGLGQTVFDVLNCSVCIRIDKFISIWINASFK